MNNDIRNLSKWLNEEQLCDIDRQALARVLAFAQQADHSEQHLDMVKAQLAQQEQLKACVYCGQLVSKEKT